MQQLSITAASLPNGLVGNVYPSQTLTATGGTPPYTWSLASGSLPAGLTLSPAGVISGTTTSTTTQVNITTNTLPNGAVDTAYTAPNLAATGGTQPYTWSVSSGTLPPGLTLSNTGSITGTPSTADTYRFTIGLTDSSTPPLSASRQYTIIIQPKITITSSPDLPLAVAGALYRQQLVATGPQTMTWSAVSALPPGLSLGSTGLLSGTPSLAGFYDFTVQVSANDPPQSARQTFQITVNQALAFTTVAALPDATLNAPYSVTIEAIGGVPPYTWSNPGRPLPAGLTLSNSGVISGTPTGLGTFTFTIAVRDSFTTPLEVSRNFTLVVAAPLSITTATLPSAFLNQAYSHRLQASGGTAPYTWVVAAGTLPDGLTLSTAAARPQ
jgi:hypothetical protein